MNMSNIINRYSFVTRWSDEDFTFNSYALEVPSVIAHGVDEATAISELKEALRIALEWMIEDGHDLR